MADNPDGIEAIPSFAICGISLPSLSPINEFIDYSRL